jgi:hypothetical protein
MLDLMWVLLLWLLLLLLSHLKLGHEIHDDGLVILWLRSFLRVVNLMLLMLARDARTSTPDVNILYRSSRWW